MIDFIKDSLDIFLYGGSIFVILYYYFTTSKAEKIRDIRNKINELSDMFSNREKGVSSDKDETSKSENTKDEKDK